MKKKSDHYLKLVEWSEEDACYIGTSPGLFLGGVHGHRQEKVFQALCTAIDQAIQVMEEEGKPLPKPTADKHFSGKIALRIPPDLHKSLAVRALREGSSINQLIMRRLKLAV